MLRPPTLRFKFLSVRRLDPPPNIHHHFPQDLVSVSVHFGRSAYLVLSGNCPWAAVSRYVVVCHVLFFPADTNSHKKGLLYLQVHPTYSKSCGSDMKTSF